MLKVPAAVETNSMTQSQKNSQPASTLGQILRLELPVMVRMGERAMSVDDVIGLAPGSIIELTKRADTELDLLINNKLIGFGQAVKVGENFGLRLTYVGDVKDRIVALGEVAAAE